MIDLMYIYCWDFLTILLVRFPTENAYYHRIIQCIASKITLRTLVTDNVILHSCLPSGTQSYGFLSHSNRVKIETHYSTNGK